MKKDRRLAVLFAAQSPWGVKPGASRRRGRSHYEKAHYLIIDWRNPGVSRKNGMKANPLSRNAFLNSEVFHYFSFNKASNSIGNYLRFIVYFFAFLVNISSS